VRLLTLTLSSKSVTCQNAVVDGFKNTSRDLNATYGQIEEGIENIYGDFRNRSISVVEIVDVVALQLQGESDEKVEKMLQGLRKIAAQN